MVSTSKILTVSYGTFSCTLEGFDDAFDTMKAIAEYFRDLAADDRYFGAEPPTPDAEMLARIAEKEISRRVNAREEAGKIVLRAETALELPQAAATEPAGAPAETPAMADEAPERPAEETPDDQLAPEVAEEPAAEPEAPADELPAAAAPEVEIAEEAESEDAAEAAAETGDAVQDDADADLAIRTAMASLRAEAAPEERQTEEEALAAEPVETEPAAAAVAEPDSVAEKLERIRSVVEKTGQAYPDDYSEDEHAQSFLTDTARELDAVLAADDAAEPAIRDAAEAEPEAPEADASAGEPESPAAAEFSAPADKAGTDDEDIAGGIAAALSQATADDLTATTRAEDAEDTEDAGAAPDMAEIEAGPDTGLQEKSAPETAEDTLAQLLADAMPDATEPEAEARPEPVAEAAADETAEADSLSEPLVLTGDVQIVDEEPAAAEGERPLRARVVKMKRADFEAAIAGGQIEEDLEEDELAAGGSGLSPEEEADLQRELAEVEAELGMDTAFDAKTDDAIAATDAEAEPEAEAEAAERGGRDTVADDENEKPAGARETRGIERLRTAAAERDVSRLFDETDTQLEEPESTRRRSAIQHLRAAVAATKAEKRAVSRLVEEPDEEPDEDAYGPDLDSVVRPRRPMPTTERARSRRPAETRPAPLKLVAEQRVDTPREPVRPRRVTAAQAAAAATAQVETAGGFSEFAEQIGATTLSELLEAAAAYMADVEGREQFSRPMLMGKLKEVELEDFSREDGLRSFGHLLRQGKLQKVKGGRFSVTDQTEYREEARSAG